MRQALLISCISTALFAGLGFWVGPRLVGRFRAGPPPRTTPSTPAVPSPSPAHLATASPSAQELPWQTGQRFGGLEDAPNQLARCQENLANLGQRLAQAPEVKSMGELARLAPAEATCPTTRLHYAWLEQSGHIVLYCSGEGHPGAQLHWDGVTKTVSRQWPEIDAKASEAQRIEHLALRELAYRWDGNWQSVLEVLKQLEPLGVAPEYLAFERATAYEGLNLVEEALAASSQALEHAPADENVFNARCNALLMDEQFEEVISLCQDWLERRNKDSELARQNILLARMLSGDRAGAEELASQIRDAGFRASVDLAYRRYNAAWENAESYKNEHGWPSGNVGEVVLTGLLACRVGNLDPELSRARLLEALQSAPKVWPYPAYRYLNGEIGEEELFQAAGDRYGLQLSAKFTVALDLMARGLAPEKVRNYLSDVAQGGYYSISLVAAAFLEELGAGQSTSP